MTYPLDRPALRLCAGSVALAVVASLGILLFAGELHLLGKLAVTALLLSILAIVWSGRRVVGSLARLDRQADVERRRAEGGGKGVEAQLLQAEKLATVGKLAAGVAHELNNPLAGILLYCDLLIESTPPGDPRIQNMKRIAAQAKRAREIVKGLLDFARATPSAFERVDLNLVVSGVLDLLDRLPELQNVQVRLELSTDPLFVSMDRVKMEQVFINVILNAAEAMGSTGTLTVRTGRSEKAGYCRAAFTDTGRGIPEEILPHIFEPFFSTKEVGKGTGLGLAVSYGIVQQHGGEIEVQSSPRSGTTFRLLLPEAQDPPAR